MGEVRRYDPFSKFEDIMLYEVDSFGFVPGFVSKELRLMSKDDLKADENLQKEFEESQYVVWKRYNIVELIREYDVIFKNRDNFELFCKRIYKSTLENKKDN